MVAVAGSRQAPSTSRLRLELPRRVLSRFGRGFLDFYDVQVPFDPGAHPRMHGVLLVALFAFTLWVATRGWGAAAWPRRGRARRRRRAGPGRCFRGTTFCAARSSCVGVLVAIVSLRRGPLRGLGAALAVGALVLVAAVAASSSPAFAKRAFLDWQNWDPYDHPTKPVDVSYVWNSSYDGLTFPRKPTTVLRIEAGSDAAATGA